MSSFSSITIIGHLGRDAEAKTAGTSTVVEFSIAVTRTRKDQESTTWFRCAFWGERAAKVSQYLNKGKAVMVQGECYERKYEKDGQQRTSLEVEVRELVLLGDGRQQETQAAPVASRTAAAADDSSPPF